MSGVCFGASLSITGTKMTLKADGVLLQDLLGEAFAHGIEIKIDPDINPVITADFADKDIQKAFEDLLKGYNHAFIWSQDSSGAQKLSQVVIFREGHMDQARNIRSAFRRNLDVIKNSETGAYYVKNRFLITFSRPVSKDRTQRILEKFNAKITPVHRDMGIYAVTVQDAADIQPLLERLNREGIIAGAEPDYAYQAPETQRAITILENSLPAAQTDPIQVADDSFSVAVLDTGLMAEYAGNDFIKGSFDALSPDSPISDDVGHGTQMALIASGQVAPMGTLPGEFANPVLSVRAFDDNGFTSNTIIMQSIDYALENGARVLSLSWGSEIDSAFLKSAMNYAVSKGLVVVAAAGNSPTGKPVYPAAYEPVIAVSALAPDGNTWDQSNYGDFVDLSAPGFASLPVGSEGEPGTYAGTSISTAYLAGKLAAFLRGHPDAETISPDVLMNPK
nr:S8 family serine peptidase [uncultured Desulfobacter sp.]